MTQLTFEARDLIRKYVLTLVVLPASVLSVVGFALGWFVNEGARGAAYAEAYSEAQSEIVKLATAAAKSAANAATAEQNSKRAEKALKESLKTTARISKEAEIYGEKLKAVVKFEEGVAAEVAKELLKTPRSLTEKITTEFGERLLVVEKEISVVEKEILSLGEIGKNTVCEWIGISNQSGGHAAATKGKSWVGTCPAGSFTKSFRLQTYLSQSTYHHAVECCALR